MWPDNWLSVIVFKTMRTQWRASMGGYYGLDMSVLPEIWRRLKVPPSQRDDVFYDLQVMEDAALGFLHKKKAGP